MKHWYNTAASIWLSILLVWTGAGIALMHCNHSGHTEVVQTSVGAGHSRCCCAKAPCMTVKVMKLAPTLPASTFTHSFTQVPVMLAPFFTTTFCSNRAYSGPSVYASSDKQWHGPPRSWLTFIRILII